MNHICLQTTRRFGIFLILFFVTISAHATYTLTDADVEMDANGYIISCSYSFVDKAIIIPDILDGIAVKGIGDNYNNLFYDKDITSIQFPAGIEYIGRYGFASNMLTSVSIPEGLTSISERAFSSNRLESIVIPANVTTIGEYAFAYNLFTSITIPDGVQEIQASAFRSCKITSVTLSNTVVFIREWAFYRNLITSVTIPNSVTLIEAEAFGFNDALTGFELPTVSMTGFVDWIDGNGDHYAGGATATDKTIIYRANVPYTLTDADVEMDAHGYIVSCSYNFQASMITIPDQLDGYTVKGIGDDRNDLFYSKAITAVEFPSGLQYLGNDAFSENLLSEVIIPANVDSIGTHVFSYNLLTGLTIPNTVVFVGENAFQVNKLTTVTLSDNLTFIGDNAFRNNELTSISIPDQVTRIGRNAFIYNQLTEITLPSPLPPGAIDWIDGNGNHYDAGAVVTDLATFYKVFIPYTLTDADVEMDANGYIISCSYSFEETDIQIPAILDGIAVKGIGDNYSDLFYNKGITSVQLPEGIEYIGRAAFGKNLLTAIVFPGTVITIEGGAFSENRLTMVDIPEGVVSIGASAFYFNAYQMKKVTLPGSLTSIGEKAFELNAIDTLVIPEGITRLEKDVFARNKLTSVTLPESLRQIGPGAFWGNALESIELPSNLHFIEDLAFDRNQLTGITLPNSVTYIVSSAFTDNQFTSFNLPTPTAEGFIDWVDGDGIFHEGGKEVPVERFEPTKYRARVPYTIQDDDVEMDARGYIISCSYDFSASLITIPETLDGIAVKGVADGVNYYNPGPFAMKKIVSVQFAPGIEYIGSITFYNNLIMELDMPDSLKTVGSYAFSHNRLTSLELPGSLISIGSNSFYYNQITDISLPASISEIEKGAFFGNPTPGFVLPAPDQEGFYDWVDDLGESYAAGDSVTGSYLSVGFQARFAYTLTDEDVEVDANGYISSCSYVGAEKVIIIPDTLDGIEIKGVADGVNYRGLFYATMIEKFVLPSGLEYIGDYAFNYNRIKGFVSLPGSVLYIGDYAFSNNFDLKGIVLPAVDSAGFIDWFDIKNGITYAGGDTIIDYATRYEARFAYVLTDEDVEVDANGNIISFNPSGKKAAAFSKGGTDIAIPDTLDGYAIKGIADGAGGKGVFSDFGLTNVILPPGMEYIGAFAFNTNALDRMVLPKNIVFIGEQAFANNQLTDMVLPVSDNPGFLGWIDTKNSIAYEGGAMITDFSGVYEAQFAYILTDDDVEMDDKGNIISCSYSFDTKDIVIPDSLDGKAVLGIADGTVNSGIFYNKGITSVVLPPLLAYIGDHAFGTNQLAELSIPEGVTYIGTGAFDSNVLSELVLPPPGSADFVHWVDGNANHYDGGITVTDLGTSFHAVYLHVLTDEEVEMDAAGNILGCNYSFETQDIVIPDTLDGHAVTGIADGSAADGVFYNKAIASIALPSHLAYIGSYAFHDNQLSEIDLPVSIRYIGSNAFGANDLTGLVLPASSVTGFVDWFNGNGEHFDANASVTDLSTYYRAAFPYTLTDGDVELDGDDYIINCLYNFEASIITIPDTLDGSAVKGIGDNYNDLFSTRDITAVHLPSMLAYIGNNAFDSNLLMEVEIPNSVSYIGSKAFSNNLLEGVTIPNSVHYIGDGAFQDNPLTGMVLPEAVKEGYTFENWNGSIAANTEVTDLAIYYEANFTLETGVEDDRTFRINLYPNPVTYGTLHISMENPAAGIHPSWSLVNILGQVMDSGKLLNRTTIIDVSHMPEGVYVLKIAMDSREHMEHRVIIR